MFVRFASRYKLSLLDAALVGVVVKRKETIVEHIISAAGLAPPLHYPAHAPPTSDTSLFVGDSPRVLLFGIDYASTYLT